MLNGIAWDTRDIINMFEPNYEEIPDEKIRNARFTALTSVIIALAVNLVASFITSYWWVSIIIFIITLVATFYILAFYTEIRTLRRYSIQSSIIFDNITGELTDYPNYIVQELMLAVVVCSGISVDQITTNDLTSIEQSGKRVIYNEMQIMRSRVT